MGKHTVKRGEGSMYQDKNGYYSYKVYYIDIDNKKKRKGFSGKDPDEIRMRAEEFLRDIAARDAAGQKDLPKGFPRRRVIGQII